MRTRRQQAADAFQSSRGEGPERLLLSRRRRFSRRAETLGDARVEIVDDQGQTAPYACFDLSAVGIYIHSDLLLTEGERVSLRISLAGHPFPLSVDGEVVRAELGEDGARSGMGIAFRNLSEEMRDVLREYVARRFMRHVGTS